MSRRRDGQVFPLMVEREGFESALKRKCKYLQSTAGNLSTWKAVVVHVNGSQKDRGERKSSGGRNNTWTISLVAGIVCQLSHKDATNQSFESPFEHTGSHRLP